MSEQNNPSGDVEIKEQTNVTSQSDDPVTGGWDTNVITGRRGWFDDMTFVYRPFERQSSPKAYGESKMGKRRK